MGNPPTPQGDDDLIAVALSVTSVLDRLGIPYYIAGSVASSLYGAVRTTHDIDVIADIRPEHIEDIIDELGQQFYADPGMILDAIRHRRSFNLLHYGSTFKVDVFIPALKPVSQIRFQRRVVKFVKEDPQQSLYMSSPEDLILSKIEWYELGHRVSDRQWADIIGVIRSQADSLDRAYLDRWAAELGITDLWQRAYTDALGEP